MISKKVTAVRKDPNKKTRKFNINRKLLGEIFSALKDVDIQQFVSKINNQKEIKPGGIMPSPSRDSLENQINFGEGLDRVYGKKPASSQEDYPEGLNPFDSNLQKRKLSARESEWLNWFKRAIATANNPRKMHEVVDKAIDIGMRMNGRHKEEWSFAEQVVLGTHFHKFKKGERKKIMRKLMVKGAKFHDTLLQNKLIGKICNELQPEVNPQVEKQLEERRKAAKNAVRGGDVIGVEMDNETTLAEYSKGSTVEIAKALKDTGPNKELGSHIIKIDGSEMEIRKGEGGKRNYAGVLGGFDITFPTSIGELRIVVYHDAKNYDQVQVRVGNQEMWAELQAKGEEVGKNCLFGGMTIKEAVKRGSFPGSGIFRGKEATEERKAVSNSSETLSSWTGRIRGSSQETLKQR